MNRMYSSASSAKNDDRSSADRRQLQMAVERRLKEKFPLEFDSRVNDDERNNAPMLLSSVRALLALNDGFKPVATPSSCLYLAEGVVVTPPRYAFTSMVSAAANYRLRAAASPTTKDRLFAQRRPPSTAPSRSSLPDFVGEDITLYRILENSAARFLDRRSSVLREWGRQRFVLPLQNARYRTRVALKSMDEARRKVYSFFDKPPKKVTTAEQNIKEETSEGKASLMSSLNSSDASSEVQETNGNNTSGRSDHDALITDEPLETLLVVSSRPKQQSTKSSDGKPNVSRGNTDEDEVIVSMALYRNMTPSTRILALPDYYVLRHSSASTLVSVSLVTFLALPMAYRSFVFSLEYGWLVGGPAIAASVMATLVFYVSNYRFQARVSQGRAIADARGARVYARDDAALWTLRDGACRAVTGAVMQEARGEGSSTFLARSIQSVVDPKELAIDFGLMPNDTAREENTK